MSKIEVIQPKDETEWLQLRTKDITSTEIAALFGLSPYITEYELWHRKKSGEAGDFEVNARMTWGNRLQGAIAGGIAADNKWIVRPKTEYCRIPAWRLGASFDFQIIDIDAILEVKNVDSLAYKEGWLIMGDSVEAPPHIELQAQHQMLCSGMKTTYIGALIGGNRVVLIKREADPEIQEQIKTKAAHFWHSIDANNAPSPDFTKDADFIVAMQNYAKPGKVLNAAGNEQVERLVKAYKMFGDAERESSEKKAAIKAELLMIIGDAEKVIGPWGSISANTVGETLIEAFTRKAFRNFRVYMKKEAKV